MSEREALREAQRLLADLTGGDSKLSIQHLWARAVEVEVRCRAALAAADRVEGEGAANQALDAIIIRCTEGDKKSDWLPVIERLAREAKAALSRVPAAASDEPRTAKELSERCERFMVGAKKLQGRYPDDMWFFELYHHLDDCRAALDATHTAGKSREQQK